MAKPGTPGAAVAIAERQGRRAKRFDADKRSAERNATPIVLGGVTLTRRTKDWSVSRAMRRTMREQEREVALSGRIRARVAELEVEQLEAAADGNEKVEGELEEKIGDLVKRSDQATEDAELVTYRLLALLLVPPAAVDGEDDPLPAGVREAFGVMDEGDEELATPAVEWMQAGVLDVEDAADLVAELTGNDEEPGDPDPTTPSSATT